jgi:recombination protein RecA
MAFKKQPEPKKKRSTKALSPTEFYKQLSNEDRDRIVDLQHQKALDLIPTGSWVLDSLIGDGTMTGKPGGLPRGHIVEVFGDESSGKTTLALSAIRKVQEMGGCGILLDFEQTFHPKYAENLGVDISSNKLIVMTPQHFQHGARLINDSLCMRPPLIVVDSVSAMTPKEVIEGACDEGAGVGLQARLMSAFLQYISKFLKDSNTCLLFLNQLRSVIKKNKFDHGPDEETSGGRALRYYSSVRLRLRKGSVEKIDVTSKITGKAGKEPMHVTVNATVVKNKIDKPWSTAPIYIRFGEGFDNVLSIVELAINTKVVKKEGNSYTFPHKGGILKVVGKENLRKALEEKDKIFEELRSSLIIREDTVAKEEYAELDKADALEEMMSNTAETYIKKENKKKGQESEPESLDIDSNDGPEAEAE